MSESAPPPSVFDLRGKRVYVAGHAGLAGSAIVRRLASEGCEVLTANHGALDLTKQEPTESWIVQARPDAIFLAAARVGGIHANDTFPVDFLADNLAIALNVAFGSSETSWIATAIALLGGLFLFAASAILIYESRYNLKFINRHIEFIEFLQDKYGEDGEDRP